jgi:hypothetical protein
MPKIMGFGNLSTLRRRRTRRAGSFKNALGVVLEGSARRLPSRKLRRLGGSPGEHGKNYDKFLTKSEERLYKAYDSSGSNACTLALEALYYAAMAEGEARHTTSEPTRAQAAAISAMTAARRVCGCKSQR